jgi:hypothetical protein
MKIRIRRSEAADREANARSGAVRELMRVAGAQRGGRQAIAVAHVAAQGELPIGENRALQRERCAHVGTGSVAAGG